MHGVKIGWKGGIKKPVSFLQLKSRTKQVVVL